MPSACLLLMLLVASATSLPVTDDMGYTTTIDSPPQRIVSLAPSNTEILFALGLGDRVVGVTEYCNYPSEALEKPKVGGYSTVSIEKVIALKPDLIVAAYGNGEALIGNLRSLGYPVIVLHPGTIEDVLSNIELVGKATGAQENADSLVSGLRARIRAVEREAQQSGFRPRTAHVIWSDPIYVSGNGTFQDELIRLAGGTNAFAHLDGWKTVGIEDFISASPEILIVNRGSGMGGGEDAIARNLREEQRFAGIPAIRENRVFLIDSDMADRAGPRIVDALEQFSADIRSAAGRGTAPAEPVPGSRQLAGFPVWAALAACAAAVVPAGCARRTLQGLHGGGPGEQPGKPCRDGQVETGRVDRYLKVIQGEKGGCCRAEPRRILREKNPKR